MKSHTVTELLYWSCAKIAIGHDCGKRGHPTYDKTFSIIRSAFTKDYYLSKSK